LRAGAVADGSGEPGWMIAEGKKEARDTLRKYDEFVAYH
jgi:hypothetical protein